MVTATRLGTDTTYTTSATATLYLMLIDKKDRTLLLTYAHVAWEGGTHISRAIPPSHARVSATDDYARGATGSGRVPIYYYHITPYL